MILIGILAIRLTFDLLVSGILDQGSNRSNSERRT